MNEMKQVQHLVKICALRVTKSEEVTNHIQPDSDSSVSNTPSASTTT